MKSEDDLEPGVHPLTFPGGAFSSPQAAVERHQPKNDP